MDVIEKYQDRLLLLCQQDSVVRFIHHLSNAHLKRILQHYQSDSQLYERLLKLVTATRLQYVQSEKVRADDVIDIQSIFAQALGEESLILIENPVTESTLQSFKPPTLPATKKQFDLRYTTFVECSQFWLPFCEPKKHNRPGFYLLSEPLLGLCRDALSQQLLQDALTYPPLESYLYRLDQLKNEHMTLALKQFDLLAQLTTKIADSDEAGQWVQTLSPNNAPITASPPIRFTSTLDLDAYISGFYELIDMVAAGGLLALEEVSDLREKEVIPMHAQVIRLLIDDPDTETLWLRYRLLRQGYAADLGKQIELLGCCIYFIATGGAIHHSIFEPLFYSDTAGDTPLGRTRTLINELMSPTVEEVLG